jgi:DNA-directed RNA polymerase subunit RPC12/RpoP
MNARFYNLVYNIIKIKSERRIIMPDARCPYCGARVNLNVKTPRGYKGRCKNCGEMVELPSRF